MSRGHSIGRQTLGDVLAFTCRGGLPPIDGAAYDVGPNCPCDELQQRLDAARALQRMAPARARPNPPLVDMSAHRCRLCTANDLDALRDELAEEMWQKHRGVFKRDCTFAEIGPYWTAVYRGLAEDAINLLRCP